MPMWLKALVAAACVIVIAVGGLFLFDRYSAWSETRWEQEQQLLHGCHEAFAEAKKRIDGSTVPFGLSGNIVIENASNDELRLRMMACGEEIPEFAEEAERLSALLATSTSQ